MGMAECLPRPKEEDRLLYWRARKIAQNIQSGLAIQMKKSEMKSISLDVIAYAIIETLKSPVILGTRSELARRTTIQTYANIKDVVETRLGTIYPLQTARFLDEAKRLYNRQLEYV
jgi:hypothetical protein